MRRFLSGMLGVLLTSAMLFTGIPQEALAATDDPKAEAKYVYDSTGRKRTGIEAITIDDVHYYDIQQGKGTLEPESGNETEFYKSVLTGEASDDLKNSSYSGKSNAIDQWAELAEAIFQDNEYYTADIHAKGDFEKNFGKRWNEAGYTDVSKALSSLESSSVGKEKNDYTKVSGLSYADSLSSVRQKASDTIVAMIGRNAITSKYEKNKKLLFDNTDGDNTLKALKNDTKQDVYYTMVTCIDEASDCDFHYNNFVLAFYDFQLVPLAGDGLQYISNAEGYDSIQDAQAANVKDVYYESNNSDKVSSYFTNNTKVANTVTMTLDASHSETASNTFSNSTSYSYSEMIGGSYALSGKIFNMDYTATFTSSFTTGQVISTAYSDTKSQTDSSSMSLTNSLSLPAHTAVAIKSSSGKTDTSIGYKCPVAVTYKVAMASLSGEVYSDSAKTLHFETAGYRHLTFSTVFGSDTSKGGTDARANLYKRAVENKDTSGFEEAYGNTYGYRWRKGGDHTTMSTLDWGKILDGNVTIEFDEIPYSVEYCEVDENGKATGKVLYSNDGNKSGKLTGEDGYEITETAPEEYTYSLTTTAEDETESESKQDYILYTGKVTEEDGSSADNTMIGSNSKTLLLSKTSSNNKIYFYYQKKATDNTVLTTNSANNAAGILTTNLTATNSDSADKNTPLSKKDITSMVGWLSTHNPLSASGGKLTYSSESKSTSVGEIVPLYPLKKIVITNDESFGDYVVSASGTDQYVGQYYDANALMDLTIYSGDKFLPNSLDLNGLDADGVTYYDFKKKYGYWEAVKKDEKGNWIPDTSTDIAVLKTDDVSGNQYVLAGNKEGTYYLQYFINDDQYQSKDQTAYATNDTVTRPVVKLNIKKSPFKGSISLTGDYTGSVNAAAVDLNKILNVFVTDEKDNHVTDQDIFWEAKEDKGITLTADGKVTFSKAGYYQVRVGSESVYSNWITLCATDSRNVGSISVSGNLSLVVGDPALSLDQYLEVTMKDASGKEVSQSHTWDVQELNGVHLSEDGKIEASKSGTYHVRAVNEIGQYSDWFAITARDPENTTQVENTTQAENTAQAENTVPNPISLANVKKSGKNIILSWTKVADAKGYEVYGNYCSGKMKKIKALPAGKLRLKISKMKGKSLVKNCYKFYVKAYKIVDNKKVYITQTPEVHVCYQKQKKYDNAKAVTLTGNASLTPGSSVSLKATVKLPKGKKQVNHIAAVRYLSSNPNIAVVDQKGTVTAKASGTCEIYAIAVNGKNAKLSIKVQ